MVVESTFCQVLDDRALVTRERKLWKGVWRNCFGEKELGMENRLSRHNIGKGAPASALIPEAFPPFGNKESRQQSQVNWDSRL